MQPQYAPQSAQVVAEAIGGRVVVINGLAKDVFADIEDIATKVAAAMKEGGRGKGGAGPSTEPVVFLRGVTFSYGGEPVLEDVNLSVGEREAVCIVGPNGGGKTTLVKLILGLLVPQQGEVRLFGQPPRPARLAPATCPSTCSTIRSSPSR